MNPETLDDLINNLDRIATALEELVYITAKRRVEEISKRGPQRFGGI